MTKSLLIINTKQFGYHSDSVEIAKKLLLKGWRITYLCVDQGKGKIQPSNGMHVVYVHSKIRAVRMAKFMIQAFELAAKHEYRHVIYFKFCFILAFLEKTMLDIRTLSVDRNIVKRKINNSIIFFESMFYEKIVAISEGVSRRLPKYKNIRVIGLSSDIIANNKKSFDRINMLYIGTLENRNIHLTVDGVAIFFEEMPWAKDIFEYVIVGSGTGREEVIIHDAINKLNLENHIKLLGYVPKDDAMDLFKTCNVGVSFIPITEYYDNQPPTKTYEYIKSGLFVVASSTSENKKTVSKDNGILVDDTAHSFANALKYIYHNRYNFDSGVIRSTLANTNWMKIAEEFEGFYLE